MATPRETPEEQENSKFIVFKDFATMDTQQNRVALDADRPAWLENLQPKGKNDLWSVPGPGAALATIGAGETIARKFYATFASADWIIVFTTAGSAYQVNLSTGQVTRFAAAGTFSGASDATQWKSERILIADTKSGYSTWDGNAFVRQGGVSPNITVTFGGSGYNVAPVVTISGGSGAGATAHAIVVGGVVTQVVLDSAGNGYQPADVLTVSFSTGAATATATVWPFLQPNLYTLAIFQGRVWLGGGRVLQWSGTLGYDNFSVQNASGFQTLSDADLVHAITVLRSANNYLYIIGDGSVKQIGTIQVTGSAPPTTQFVITTITSDQGTTFMLSVASFNRLLTFANTTGVYALFGASVEKISDPMDGIFSLIDFTQQPVAAILDLRSIRTYLLLVRYLDPIKGSRAIMLAFSNKKWWIVSQGNSIIAMATSLVNGVRSVCVSSGADITPILSNPNVAVNCLWQSALTDHERPHLNKRTTRLGITQSAGTSNTVTLTSDAENQSISQTYNLSFAMIWQNALNQVVTWVNALSQLVTFVGGGILFQPTQGNASGIYLGASLSGSWLNMHIHKIIIEYKEGAAMRSKNHP